MTLHYSRKGQPISLREWARTAEGNGTWKSVRKAIYVAQDFVGPYRVSTVWMGRDIGCGFGPPLIFETMVFERKLTRAPDWSFTYHKSLDDYSLRYPTERRALQGHWEIRRLVRRAVQASHGPRKLKAKPKGRTRA